MFKLFQKKLDNKLELIKEFTNKEEATSWFNMSRQSHLKLFNIYLFKGDNIIKSHVGTIFLSEK